LLRAKRKLQVAPGVLETRPDPQRLLKVSDRLVQLALQAECNPEIVMSIWRVRRVGQRAPELGDCLNELSSLQQNASQIVVRRAVGWLEQHGPTKVMDGLLSGALRRQRVAEVPVGLG
jgi:hypothetical protein